jgi:signal transduction histidine kinase
MSKAWKNWIKFGKISKKLNRHNFIKVYFTVGFITIISFFLGYSRLLIKELREDSKNAPALFANYIYNTKSYLDEAQENYQNIVTSLDEVNENYKQANQNSKLLAGIFEKWVASLSRDKGEEKFNEYFSSQFTEDLGFPIILTDSDFNPITWKNIDIPEIEYTSLDTDNRNRLDSLRNAMESIDVKVAGKILNRVHYLPLTNSLKEPPLPPKDFEDFIQKMQQPIIITNMDNVPVLWNNIYQVPSYVKYEQLTSETKAILTSAINNMNAIPINVANSNISRIYVNELPAIKNLNNFILLQLVLVIMFVIIGVLGIRLIKRTENDLIWVGLAKETAHQLGTPITSLLGWIEYLKIKEEFSDPENAELLQFMQSDVSHLKTIASRFGKIGSKLELKPMLVEPIINETTSYIRQRLPHLGSKIDLNLNSHIPKVMVKTEKELFVWVLENLLKNCVDAIGEKGGKIEVEVTTRSHNLVILISDTGKGIPKDLIKKIFFAGVTTKKRGWGLGLSLVKRIVEDYHKGKIRVVKSVLNEGTTFEIQLPIYNEEI